MKYKNIVKAEFVSRPNRFIAICRVLLPSGAGEEIYCHVKNTGRCRELLVPEAVVYLEDSESEKRKTRYDLVAVEKRCSGGESLLINIDSQAPNKAAYEWLFSGGLFSDITYIRPEVTYGGSRFDLYFEHGGKKAFMEVKGVTLEKDGVLLFPDAPTERGIKHLRELIRAKNEGYEAYILFVIQTEKAKYFTPNRDNHPEFAEALSDASKAGVKIMAYTCNVSRDEMAIASSVAAVL